MTILQYEGGTKPERHLQTSDFISPLPMTDDKCDVYGICEYMEVHHLQVWE